MVKVLPLWLAKLISVPPLKGFFTKLWSDSHDKYASEIIQSCTDNKDLQTVMCYCWGDFGTSPDRCHFSMMATLHQHFKHGAFYPGILR